MKNSKRKKVFPAGSGYGLGLIFGAAIMSVFSIALGATYFGVMLGLSFSLSIGIAFECLLAGEKRLPLFQRVMISLSLVFLIFSVISLIMWDEVGIW
jgi:hypothetical protein